MRFCMVHCQNPEKELTEEEYFEMAVKVQKQEPDEARVMMQPISKFIEIDGDAAINQWTQTSESFIADVSPFYKEKVTKISTKKSGLEKAKAKKEAAEDLKMAHKMAEFNQKKMNIPSPEVRHNKGVNFKTDINVPIIAI